jgi:hypothetical protein
MDHHTPTQPGDPGYGQIEITSKDLQEGARKFIADHQAAIDDLVDKIAGEAMAKLPCLAIGSQQDVRQRLHALIGKTAETKFMTGSACVGVWETDDTFVVTINDALAPEGTRIRVALCLGETRIEL